MDDPLNQVTADLSQISLKDYLQGKAQLSFKDYLQVKKKMQADPKPILPTALQPTPSTNDSQTTDTDSVKYVRVENIRANKTEATGDGPAKVQAIVWGFPNSALAGRSDLETYSAEDDKTIIAMKAKGHLWNTILLTIGKTSLAQLSDHYSELEANGMVAEYESDDKLITVLSDNVTNDEKSAAIATLPTYGSDNTSVTKGETYYCKYSSGVTKFVVGSERAVFLIHNYLIPFGLAARCEVANTERGQVFCLPNENAHDFMGIVQYLYSNTSSTVSGEYDDRTNHDLARLCNLAIKFQIPAMLPLLMDLMDTDIPTMEFIDLAQIVYKSDCVPPSFRDFFQNRIVDSIYQTATGCYDKFNQGLKPPYMKDTDFAQIASAGGLLALDLMQALLKAQLEAAVEDEEDVIDEGGDGLKEEGDGWTSDPCGDWGEIAAAKSKVRSAYVEDAESDADSCHAGNQHNDDDQGAANSEPHYRGTKIEKATTCPSPSGPPSRPSPLPLNNYRNALSYLGADNSDMDEDLVGSYLAKITSDPSTKERAQKALRLIAIGRNSVFLWEWLHDVTSPPVTKTHKPLIDTAPTQAPVLSGTQVWHQPKYTRPVWQSQSGIPPWRVHAASATAPFGYAAPSNTSYFNGNGRTAHTIKASSVSEGTLNFPAGALITNITGAPGSGYLYGYVGGIGGSFPTHCIQMDMVAPQYAQKGALW